MIEAMKQALEAWQTSVYGSDKHHKAMLLAMTKMNQAIAELESQEPVAWMKPDVLCDRACMYLCTKGFTQFPECANAPPQLEQNYCPRCGKRTNDIHTCTPPQRTEQEPVQVSPLEFVEMVMEKEHLIGKPIFWAEWPNKEKNNG